MAQLFITMRGKVADIAKVRTSLDDGGKFRGIADGTTKVVTKGEVENGREVCNGSGCNLNVDPHMMEFNPICEVEDWIHLYRFGEDDVGFFAAINSLFEPVFSAFPQVSFFIACTAFCDEIFEAGAGHACSYSVFENGTEQEKKSWQWETETLYDEDMERFAMERDHYEEVMQARFNWIEKKRELWLLEGSSDKTAIQAARSALSDAEKAAVEEENNDDWTYGLDEEDSIDEDSDEDDDPDDDEDDGDDGIDEEFEIKDGVLTRYKGESDDVRIPDGVTAIGEEAFSYHKRLTSIVIPDSVTAIGKRAFQRCESLLSIAIPDGVTVIGNLAFHGCCYNLRSIYIPDSVTAIGVSAFEDCTELAEISVPAGAEIGKYAFEGCSGTPKVRG